MRAVLSGLAPVELDVLDDHLPDGLPRGGLALDAGGFERIV
ncbi:hypothetical protein ACFLS0_06325 [Candidatus Bipolaricaulota bacterium]